MSPTKPSTGKTGAFVVAVAFAVLTAWFEIMRSHRYDYWSGWTPLEFIGAAGALVIEVGLLVALTLLGRTVLDAVTHNKLSQKVGAPISGLFAAGILWAVLFTFWPGTRPSMIAFVTAVHILLAVALIAAPLNKRISLNTAGVAATAVFLAGIAGAVAVAHILFLDPERRQRFVPIACLVWTGLAGLSVIIGVFAGRTRRRHRAVLFAILIAFITIPFFVAFSLPRIRALGYERRGPSLLLVICDAMRADYCSVYGGDVPMPTLERLAENGVRFERCYALAPWTLPSMNAMFSSSYPVSLTPGASRNQWLEEMRHYVIDPSVPMLAERLGAKGYATCALAGNRLLDQPNGILRGFQDAAVFTSMRPDRYGPFVQFPFFQDVVHAVFPALAPERPVDTGRILTRHAEVFLRRHRNASFFLWIHYMDPHTPCDPPERYRTMGGPWPLWAPSYPYWGTPQLEQDGRSLDLPESERRYAQSLYEGEMRYVDERVGEVLGALERQERIEDTFVCVTSDHGEEFWDHGWCFHGQSLYEELVRVPCVFAGPGLSRRVIAEPFSALDLMPTLAELICETPCAEWQGTSWAEVLRGQAAAPSRPLFVQGTYINAEEPMRMVLEDEMKLISRPGSDRLELYDLYQDPPDSRDLSIEQPEHAAELGDTLEAWAQSWPSTFAAAKSEDATTPESQEILDNLRTLGYLR